MDNLGNKLREIRNENNLSLAGLADRLNKKYNLTISKSMISKWENNKAEPYITYLSAYAKEFDINLNYLLGIDEEKYMVPSVDDNDEFVVLARNLEELTDDQIDLIKGMIDHFNRENEDE